MTPYGYQLIMLLSMVIKTAAPHTKSHDVLAYDCMMKPTGSQWLLQVIVGQLGVIIVQNLYYFFE